MLNDWLARDETMNNQFTNTLNETFAINASLEPLKSMTVKVTTNYRYGIKNSEFYRYQGEDFGDGNVWLSESPLETGNFSASIITFRTGFKMKGDSVYGIFLDNRETISERLAEENPNFGDDVHEGYPNYSKGYGPTSSYVLIPAFIAAYTGNSAQNVSLDPFNVGIKGQKLIPLPNWQIRYTGLSKIEKLRKVFKSVNITHQYQSTYNIGSFTSNVDYQPTENNDNLPSTIDPLSGNYTSRYQINSISIMEKFSPLIGIDMTWKNSLITRFNIKTDRSLSFALTNAQLTEVQGNSVVVGLGYTLQQIKLPWELRPGTPIQSDVRLMADFQYRKSRTTLRKIVEGTQDDSAGQENFSVKITADYKLSDKLNLRAFYDFNKNIPLISTTFPNSNSKFGVTLMFTLAP